LVDDAYDERLSSGSLLNQAKQRGFEVRPESKISFDYKSRSTHPTAANHAKWFASGLALPLLAAVIAFSLSRKPLDETSELPPLAVTDLPAPALPPVEIETPEPEPIGETTEYVVRRNDTLDRIFRQLGLSLSDLSNIRSVEGVRSRIDSLRPGDKITLRHDGASVASLSRRISETEILTVARAADGFKATIASTPIEIKQTRASGVIDSSLFVAARAAGVSPELIMHLANDIFGWKIDFALEIQPGDRFDIVYEQKYRKGEYIGDGRILAAGFVNAGTSFRAVYFESSDGKIGGYFAPDGRSMRRQFLRAPLDFTRISSNFNPRRRHPILNTIRAHKGVDYAAPAGTIIKAAGDGRVSFVGTKGGYGRVVILEHGGGISTLYGHMSRFAKGLRNGQRVNQGETIGYVGSTGAATGPHLHYEYRLNGVHKNPRTVPLPDAAPIPMTYMPEFQARSGTLLADLDRAEAPSVAAIPDT
jgi:murein DD-endopeptidase MepM/ murein hydrolase activator NlpD